MNLVDPNALDWSGMAAQVGGPDAPPQGGAVGLPPKKKGPVMVINNGGATSQNDFGSGMSTAQAPSGQQVQVPLGGDVNMALFNKMAGSTNTGDVLEAFRQQMAKMPRSVSFGPAPLGSAGSASFNPESEADYQNRGMAQFKTASDLASDAEKLGLQRILGIGNMGINQGKLGVEGGQLEVARRAQQLAEQRAGYDMSKSGTGDRLLAGLLAGGADAGKVSSAMRQYQKFSAGANALPAQPFGGNSILGQMGMGGGAPPPPQPPLGAIPPGPGVAPAGGGAAGQAGGAPPGPGGVLAGPGGMVPRPGGFASDHPEAPDWSSIFGQSAVDATKPEATPDVGSFLTALKRNLPGGEQEFAQKLDQAMKYAGTRFSQKDLNKFIQPTALQQLGQRTSNIFSQPSDSEVLASQIRNAQGKRPTYFNRIDKPVGSFSSVGDALRTAIGM